MNIGERFFCSRCLAEMEDEGVCPCCGYDPENKVEVAPDGGIEEGTLLEDGRYQVGAVIMHLKNGYIYGAYDHLRSAAGYILELGDVYRENEKLCLFLEKNAEKIRRG